MKKLSGILVVLLVSLMVFGAALSESILDTIPDTAQWGISRTKFKELNGNVFESVTAGGYQALAYRGRDVEGWPMDVYFIFAERQGSYYGLSEVVYLLDVTKKVSDANLKKCFNALVDAMSDTDRPAEAGASTAIWRYLDCNMAITVDKFTEVNGSKNKTVAIIFTLPDDASAQQASGSAYARTMTVTPSATCSNTNQVGSNGTQVFYLNGKKIGDSASVTLSAGDVVTVRAVVTEQDGNPDVGENEQSYTVTQADLDGGFRITFSVKVTENGGRYNGRSANWRVSFTFK